MCLHSPLPITKQVKEQKIWYKHLRLIDGSYTTPYWGGTPMHIGHRYTRNQLEARTPDGHRLVPKGVRLLYDDFIGQDTVDSKNYYYPGIHCYQSIPHFVQKLWHGRERLVEVRVGQIMAYGFEKYGNTDEVTGVFRSVTLLRDVTELVKTGKLTG